MLSIEHQPQYLWMTNLDFILRRILDKSKFPTHRGIWQDCICFIISSPMFCCFLNIYPHRIGFKQQDIEIRIVLLGHFLSPLTFIAFLLVHFIIEARNFWELGSIIRQLMDLATQGCLSSTSLCCASWEKSSLWHNVSISLKCTNNQ